MRPNSECLQPKTWCKLYHGLGQFSQWCWEFRQNVEKSRQILIHNAKPSGKSLIVNSFIFQHGNNTNCTASSIKALTVWKTHSRKTTQWSTITHDWPPQSPDLNIIDSLWEHQNKRQATTKEELWMVFKTSGKLFLFLIFLFFYCFCPSVGEVCCRSVPYSGPLITIQPFSIQQTHMSSALCSLNFRGLHGSMFAVFIKLTKKKNLIEQDCQSVVNCYVNMC